MSELWGVISDNFPQFASGFWMTLRVVLVSLAIALGVGTLVAALRAAPTRPLRWLGGFYVETFRNLPLLVLLIILFAGLRRMGIPLSQFVAGASGLGLYT